MFYLLPLMSFLWQHHTTAAFFPAFITSKNSNGHNYGFANSLIKPIRCSTSVHAITSASASTSTSAVSSSRALSSSSSSSSPSQCHQQQQQSEQKPPALVFVLNGQGSQWNGMGRDLIDSNPIFRSTIEKLQTSSGIPGTGTGTGTGQRLPLVELFRDGSKWQSKEYSALGIVSFQLGLLAILRESGVRSPDCFLGHSVGELACPFLAGLVSEEEVLQYAMVRTSLTNLIDTGMRLDLYKNKPRDGFDYRMRHEQNGDCGDNVDEDVGGSISHKNYKFFVKQEHQDTPKDPSVIKSFSMDGQMVVIGSSASELNSMIAKLGLRQLCVACYNAPSGQTVSGASDEIDILVEHIQKTQKKTFIRPIDTDHIAYHGVYLEAFRDFLKDEFGKVRAEFSFRNECQGKTKKSKPKSKSKSKSTPPLEPPPLPIPPKWISTSTSMGSEKSAFSFDSDYLVDNILRPVYFQEAIECLPEGSTIVEVGPSPILISQIKRIRSDVNQMSLYQKDRPGSMEEALDQLKGKWPIVAPEPELVSAVSGSASAQRLDGAVDLERNAVLSP